MKKSPEEALTVSRYFAVSLLVLTVIPTFGQIPKQWHQPPSQEELQFAGQLMRSLMQAPDFPTLKGWNISPGSPPEMQINAYERGKEIFLPVEMFRFLKDDPGALTFLIAHEAGHAKQEEIYGESCYTAKNMKMSKFDWVRTLGDVAGGAATKGVDGAATAAANVQKQACEDNADAWGVRFMREAGLDAASGIRLFNRLDAISQNAGWQGLATQFFSDHSINPVRVAHITALILQKQKPQ